jgi:hypothetical protein
LRAPHEIKGAVIENTERGLVIVLHVGNERRILGQYRGGIRFFRSSMARRQCSMACCTGRRMQKAGFRELWKRRSGVQMDEKAKPRVAAGLGKWLEPQGVTDAGDQTHPLWSAL